MFIRLTIVGEEMDIKMILTIWTVVYLAAFIPKTYIEFRNEITKGEILMEIRKKINTVEIKDLMGLE